VLQYRQTDDEISNDFEKLEITTTISHISIDSLKRQIRIQKIINPDSQWSILFIHGSPSSLTAWRKYMASALLREQASLYAVDRPGYGYSNFGNALASIDKQAKLLNRIIDNAEGENLLVIGTSYGAPIAARMATENPDIKGVMLLSAAMDPENEKNIYASRFTQWPLTRWLVPTGYRVAGDEKTVHAAQLDEIKEDWKLLEIPVYHLHGNKDDIVPVENVEFTKKNFKNTTTKIYQNIDHDLAWEHPDLIIPEILEFLETIKSN
jgi:pimeloyl-ACP methyl ester carboxylesterase